MFRRAVLHYDLPTAQYLLKNGAHINSTYMNHPRNLLTQLANEKTLRRSQVQVKEFLEMCKFLLDNGIWQRTWALMHLSFNYQLDLAVLLIYRGADPEAVPNTIEGKSALDMIGSEKLPCLVSGYESPKAGDTEPCNSEVAVYFMSTLQHRERLIRARDRRDQFLDACRHGRVAEAKGLLRNPLSLKLDYSTSYIIAYEDFVDPMATDSSRQNALTIAAKNKQLKIMQLLLDTKQVNINYGGGCFSKTALMNCIEDGYYEGAKLLLKNGADVNLRSKYEDGRDALTFSLFCHWLN